MAEIGLNSQNGANRQSGLALPLLCSRRPSVVRVGVSQRRCTGGAERSRQLLFVQPFGVSKQCSFLLLAAKDVHCFFPAPPMYYVFPFSTFSVFFKVVTEVC